MRNKILELIYQCWEKSPELRFNQLISSLQLEYCLYNKFPLQTIL